MVVNEYRQQLDYEETSLFARIDHLLTNEVSVGASARWQRVELDESTNAPITSTNPLLNDTTSDLYVGSLYGRYQMADGWFVTGEAQYWMQDNDLGVPLSDAGMPVLNLSVGRTLSERLTSTETA